MEISRRAFGGVVAGAVAVAALPVSAGADKAVWLRDLPWIKANHGAYHQITVRVPGPSITAQCRFDLRTSASLASDIFSGEAWQADSFVGLGTFFGVLDPGKAQNARNVIDGKSAGQRTSIYAVGWGKRSIHMVSRDGALSQTAAICVMDWRYASRVANLDPCHTTEGLLDLALLRLPKIRGNHVRTVLYMNDDCWRALGKPPEHRGVPIQAVAISNRQALVA